MTDEIAESNPDAPDARSGMNRRDAVKRGAMVTGAVGAAWAAPMVYDSFASPASASGTQKVNSRDPDETKARTVTIAGG